MTWPHKTRCEGKKSLQRKGRHVENEKAKYYMLYKIREEKEKKCYIRQNYIRGRVLQLRKSRGIRGGKTRERINKR